MYHKLCVSHTADGMIELQAVPQIYYLYVY